MNKIRIWRIYHGCTSRQSSDYCEGSYLPKCSAPIVPRECAHHSNDTTFNGCCEKAVQHLNVKQTPVVVFDQHVYTIAEQIQRKWPKCTGVGEAYVVMFLGLHMGMAVLKTLSDWLQGIGWVEVLVQAGIVTGDTANLFLHW